MLLFVTTVFYHCKNYVQAQFTFTEGNVQEIQTEKVELDILN